MYIIYNFLVLCVCCLFVLPYFLYRCICEAGFTTRMRQSLGGLRDEEIASVAQKDCIWIHGASVGEIVATSPLVKEIRKAYPDSSILFRQFTDFISTSRFARCDNQTGLRIAFNNFIKHIKKTFSSVGCVDPATITG